MIKQAIDSAQLRFQEEIQRASKGKKVDQSRIKRRKNEQYPERLVRSCLGISQHIELNDSLYALAMATPEALMSKMYYMGWGDARKQKDTNEKAPELMKLYGEFSSSYSIPNATDMVQKIKDDTINKSLICHGLSPTSDTILLLAELGRSVRMTKALGIKSTEILLADISWIKYNRSISQMFNKKDFLDQLRVCIDKRKRLYKALGLKYTTFGISDFGESTNYIKKSNISEATQTYRELASALWGKESLSKQNADMKALIGKSFQGFSKKNLSQIPNYLKILLRFDHLGNALENSLTDELTVLRTLSELFSTFDEEVFIYYFAQYFAQSQYNNYLKMAPYSEIKFDAPFEKNSEHFNHFIKRVEKKKIKTNGHVYYPQYRLGKYEILPYTSISGDIIKQKLNIQDFKSGTILLNDSYHSETDKVLGVLTETPIHHRNRLLSDLLSFLHLLVSEANLDSSMYQKIKEVLYKLDAEIGEQIFSQETIDSYPQIFSNALKAITDTDVVLPFHLIPYTWDEKMWTAERHKDCALLIKEILVVVNEMCE